MKPSKRTPGRTHHDYPEHRETAHGTACCICGNRPCLRTFHKNGYCVDHIRDAYAAAQAEVRSAK